MNKILREKMKRLCENWNKSIEFSFDDVLMKKI